MTIDSVGYGKAVPVHPASSPARVVVAGGADGVKRQELPGSGQSAPPPESAQQKSDVRQAVQDLNQYAQSLRRDLHFSVDEESGETLVRVLDPESGEVIRQIPSEEVLSIARSLEKAQGLLFNTQA